MLQRGLNRRYKIAEHAPSASFDQSRFAGGLMRALAKFPEARKAVIAEFDRIGGMLL
jgi:hypothetical protein